MSKSCQICLNNPFKYKCPTCYFKYCSAACFKTHKETSCQKPEPPTEETADQPVQYRYPTEDTVGIEELKALGDSQEVKECLANPHVRRMLSQLAACSSGADAAVKEAMQEPIFLELASACLRVVEPEKFETEKFEAEQYD